MPEDSSSALNLPMFIAMDNPTHMRRTAKEDCEIRCKQIRAGESIIDRPNARQHLSLGFGVRRCLGNRLVVVHPG